MTAPSAQTPSQQEVVADRRFFGHPRGLGTLFLVEMWERFSFYGNRPLLVLFMTAALTSGGYGFQRPMASAIVGSPMWSCQFSTGSWLAIKVEPVP